MCVCERERESHVCARRRREKKGSEEKVKNEGGAAGNVATVEINEKRTWQCQKNT